MLVKMKTNGGTYSRFIAIAIIVSMCVIIQALLSVMKSF